MDEIAKIFDGHLDQGGNLVMHKEEIPANLVYTRKVRLSNSVILNKPGHHSTAALTWIIDGHVKCHGDEDPSSNVDVDATLNITDCYKGVRLDFDFSMYTNHGRMDIADMENSLYKIDRLIEELHKFRDGLNQAATLKDDMDNFIKHCPPRGVDHETESLEEVIRVMKHNIEQKKIKDELKQNKEQQGRSQTESQTGSLG